MDPPYVEQWGFVGICPQVEIQFKGKRVCCLLDTESQVTLMTEDNYRRVFTEQGLGSRGVVGWLSLRAANGLELPYVGYALMDGQVGEVRLPGKGIVVTKDRGQEELPILGMNVISACWDVLFANPQVQATFFHTVKWSCLWDMGGCLSGLSMGMGTVV